MALFEFIYRLNNSWPLLRWGLFVFYVAAMPTDT